MKTLDLREFVENRSDELSQMLAAIKGDVDSILWTAQMRTAVRGGKPLGGPRLEDSTD